MGSSVLHGGGAPLEAQDHVGRVAEEALRPFRRRRGAVLRGDEGVELFEGDVDRAREAGGGRLSGVPGLRLPPRDHQSEARPAIVEPPKDDVDTASIVTPDNAANSSILKMSGAPASKRRRVFDDRLNVVPLGPLPTERPLGPSAHEIWFGRPED